MRHRVPVVLPPTSAAQLSVSDPSAETEQVSLAHLQLAHNMREEAKKLEEFRVDQKERRKKVGGARWGGGAGLRTVFG